MNYWLLKTDPKSYSWENLLNDGFTDWDGVRNYQARNNLKLMKKGDLALIYHSIDGKAVVGIAKISKEYYPDPKDNAWVAVGISPYKELKNQVSLELIKSTKYLENIALIKQSRLSVMPMSLTEYNIIIKLAQ
jgi:predicted RNA-binding protein with PUA-like domain